MLAYNLLLLLIKGKGNGGEPFELLLDWLSAKYLLETCSFSKRFPEPQKLLLWGKYIKIRLLLHVIIQRSCKIHRLKMVWDNNFVKNVVSQPKLIIRSQKACMQHKAFCLDWTWTSELATEWNIHLAAFWGPNKREICFWSRDPKDHTEKESKEWKKMCKTRGRAVPFAITTIIVEVRCR